MENEVSEVERALLALYGPRPLIAQGVVHVSSSVRAADGRLHVIRIGERSPASESDFFALNACRARADAILTTAKNLRAEPRLHHALQGAAARGLARYRRERLGKADPPWCAIMTRSGDLPLAHAAFSDGTPKLVLTVPEAASSLQARLGSRAEVVGIERLDARGAVQRLHTRGHALISVEAGPSTSGALYEPPSLVDELLLSIYDEPVDAALLGGALPEAEALFRERSLVHALARVEESGRWRFERWQREALSR